MKAKGYCEYDNGSLGSIRGRRWRWRSHRPPHRWYPTTSLSDVTTHTTKTRPSITV